MNWFIKLSQQNTQYILLELIYNKITPAQAYQQLSGLDHHINYCEQITTLAHSYPQGWRQLNQLGLLLKCNQLQPLNQPENQLPEYNMNDAKTTGTPTDGNRWDQNPG